MTPQEIEKAAEKMPDEIMHGYCCCAHDVIHGYQYGFRNGASLVMERVRRLENTLKLIQTDAAICHDDALYTICDAALEGKES